MNPSLDTSPALNAAIAAIERMGRQNEVLQARQDADWIVIRLRAVLATVATPEITKHGMDGFGQIVAGLNGPRQHIRARARRLLDLRLNQIIRRATAENNARTDAVLVQMATGRAA